jgi:hypothetical protein
LVWLRRAFRLRLPSKHLGFSLVWLGLAWLSLVGARVSLKASFKTAGFDLGLAWFGLAGARVSLEVFFKHIGLILVWLGLAWLRLAGTRVSLAVSFKTRLVSFWFRLVAPVRGCLGRVFRLILNVRVRLASAAGRAPPLGGGARFCSLSMMQLSQIFSNSGTGTCGGSG